MNQVTNWLRKNIGLIVSIVGLTLLVILTFGDIGELFTEEYWRNVGGNISSIGALSIGLVLIQTTIKQGISEQALSAGLNTPETKKKYEEHKKFVKENQEKHVYLPYFLTIRNCRETKRRKREFLVDNNFTSEEMLRLSNKKKLIRQYDKIQTNITVDSIKWSTTEIIYNKQGRIEKLEKYRKRRAIKGVISGFIFMLATAFITGGMYLDAAEIPLWQKFVKLATYLIVMALSVVLDIGKNYEKGAFGVPNELEEINGIWEEFSKWEIPEWVKLEVANNEKDKTEDNDSIGKEEIKSQNFQGNNVILLGCSQIEEIKSLKEECVHGENRKESFDTGTTIQKESTQSEDI